MAFAASSASSAAAALSRFLRSRALSPSSFVASETASAPTASSDFGGVVSP